MEKKALSFAIEKDEKERLNISLIRLAPFVYGHNGSHFVPLAIDIAKKNKASYYLGINNNSNMMDIIR